MHQSHALRLYSLKHLWARRSSVQKYVCCGKSHHIAQEQHRQGLGEELRGRAGGHESAEQAAAKGQINLNADHSTDL